jgi:MoxR-like ATPase
MAELSTNLKKHEYLIDRENKFQPSPTGEWSELVLQIIYPYYPSQGLVEAVNLALRLNRPLLLEGEPGCGKSQLAAAVAYQFNKRYPEIAWRYQLWNVQSTSKAQDGFYTYDYVGRLQAAQLAKEAVIIDEKNDPTNPENFIDWGPLGEAFRSRQCEETNRPIRTIVLVDEIDKADRDLPNDLLLAIDQQKFEIKDVRPRRWQSANKDAPPIIFITSNREKELPNAFLRRCLYHYVDFPETETLKKIINTRVDKLSEKIVEKALKRFLELREDMEGDKDDGDKKISTSELIDWVKALYDYPPKEIEKMLDKPELPCASTLLKNHEDYNQYKGSISNLQKKP